MAFDKFFSALGLRSKKDAEQKPSAPDTPPPAQDAAPSASVPTPPAAAKPAAPAVAPQPATVVTSSPIQYSFNLTGVGMQNTSMPRMASATPSAPPPSSPSNLSPTLQQAMALHQQGNLAAAKAAYESILQADPHHAEALNLLGVATYQLKDVHTAEKLIRQAIELIPDNANYHCNLGNVLKAQRQLEAALACYQRALTLNPADLTTQNNLGTIYNDFKNHAAALECFDYICQQRPTDAIAHFNRGNTLFAMGKDQAAIDCFSQVLKLNPRHGESFLNRGLALVRMKRYAEAIQDYNQALALSPHIDFLLGTRLFAKRQICDWSQAQKDVQDIIDGVKASKNVTQPMYLLMAVNSAETHRQGAEIYVKHKYPPNPVLGALAKSAKPKIRVGYFSGDFRDHPVLFLTAELFEAHDKDRFELIAISYQKDDQSDMRRRVEPVFDQFIDVQGQSDLEIARLARDLQLDIAVDLGGLTDGARPGVFAMRVAPVQVNYIGYPGTMGAPYMDYILADTVVVPPDQVNNYSEKVVYLPCYQVNDTHRKVSDRVFSRDELGLPATGFVFCSFNQTWKITPDTFDDWMAILRQVDGSVLLMLAEDEDTRANLRKEAQARDVNPDRLVFCGRLPSADYMARCRTADLFLDSLPYNAGTTASDALWAGLPVLTLAGESFPSRMAASLLQAIGLPELTTTTRAAYIDKAVQLAKSPSDLQQIKARLQANKQTSLLFNTRQFTEHLEAAYAEMHRRAQAELPTDHIDAREKRASTSRGAA